MNIRPQDLGKQFEERLLRQRTPAYDKTPFVSVRTSAGLFLGSFAGMLLSAVFQWTIGLFLLIVTVITASMFISSAHQSPSRRRLTGSVIEYEINSLCDDTRDALAQEYLTLVSKVISVTTPIEADAEAEVRQAVHALGTAIASLPDYGREVIAENPAAMRMEAARLELSLQTEEDPVIRASRQRRIESLQRRAETASYTITLLRRHRALRDEVAEQIKALHTNLAAFSVSGRHSIRDLTSLAASIQSVTVEANAITAARAEIDAVFSAPTGMTQNGGETQPLRRIIN
jgi:hypothetical protein